MTIELEVRPTSRPRHGRRFEPTHERALREAALRSVSTLPNAQDGIVVIPEMAGPLGVPDFVALIGPPGLLENRLNAGTPPLLNEVDAGIVATLNVKRPLSAVTVAEKLNWPQEVVMRRLPQLIKNGSALECSSKNYVKPAHIVPVGRIYAIEMKIRDWQRAVKQGRTYRTWADNYVLVFDSMGPLTHERVRNEVEIDDGGLVVDGKWRRRPRIQQLDRARRLWASEYVVAAAGTYQPSSRAYNSSPSCNDLIQS